MSTNRATLWALTINNPTPADEECINLARQKGWKVEGQLERGEGGTLHYQLSVRTPQVRFSAVKKQFPRAHIGVARKPEALANYVTKEDTRVAPLPSTQEQYPSLSRMWELIYDELTTEEPGSCWRYIPGGFSHFRDEKQALEFFDWAIRRLIRKGYVLETLGVNPQNRSAFARYADPIFHRIYIRRQSDSQTEMARLEQHVDIPTMVHNNAEAGSSLPPLPPSPSRSRSSSDASDASSSSHSGC